MRKAPSRKTSDPSFLASLVRMGTTALGAMRPLARRLREELEGRTDRYVLLLERRLAVLALRGFILVLAVSFIGFGILFTLMDVGGASRGVACLLCGLTGVVLSLVRVRFTENGKGSA